MNTKTLIPILSLIIFIFTVTISNAQRQPFLGVTDVPPNESNNRFYNDISAQINRPALSVVGFDNGNDHSKGYGLKQILNQAYVSGSNEQKELLIKILDESLLTITPNPTSRQQYQRNSNILQYRAFEALASYVLEQNGVNPSSFDI